MRVFLFENKRGYRTQIPSTLSIFHFHGNPFAKKQYRLLGRKREKIHFALFIRICKCALTTTRGFVTNSSRPASENVKINLRRERVAEVIILLIIPKHFDYAPWPDLAIVYGP
jgi:hypothetical protein